MKKTLIAVLTMATMITAVACGKDTKKGTPKEQSKVEANSKEKTDSTTAASADATTSASIVKKELIQAYKPKGFTSDSKKKAIFIVGDPRKDSVHYDMVNTAMKHFEEKGVEVELRDLYDLKFNPVVQPEEFYYAKDGKGEAPKDVKAEQELINKADYIIFSYPNWHDTPNAIVKGYMERVFAKKWAYKDGEKGLEGLLKGKSIFTIQQCGFLGGGRGFIGDGVGINNAAWDQYMKAFKVLDDDTAGFWGVENKGRFVNDRTPKNTSESYEKELKELRSALTAYLDKTFFK